MNNPSLKRFQSPKQREMQTQIQWQQPAQQAERDPTDQMKDEIAQFLNLKLAQHELAPQRRTDAQGDHLEPHVVSGADSGARPSRALAYSPGTEEQAEPDFRETLLLGRTGAGSPAPVGSGQHQVPGTRLHEISPSSDVKTVESRRPVEKLETLNSDGQEGEELSAPPHQVAAGRPPADGRRPKGDASAD